MNSNEIMNSFISFVIVAVVLLAFLYVSLNIYCKKFVLTDKKIKFYGLFLNMNTDALVAISSLTINFVFLVWWTLSFNGLNVIYIVFSLILMIISNVTLNNSSGVLYSVLYTAISSVLIEVIYLIYNYVTVEYFNFMLLVILFLLILFSFLFYVFVLFRSINNIVTMNKFIKKKDEYKV